MSEAGTTIANSESSSANWEDPRKAVPARVAAKLQPTEIEAPVEAVERGEVPHDIDAQLLSGARSEIGRDLNPT